MPFRKGRAKTGGRVKGSHNKITLDVRGLCDERGFNPMEALIELAKNSKDERIRLVAADKLARRIWPELQSIEVSGPGGGPIEHSNVSAVDALESELAGLASRGAAPANPAQSR